jgi:AcrR family transcriptional regulator
MNHHPGHSFPERGAVPELGAGLTRRTLAKQRTRQRLLGAARRLFIARGYEAATIRDIASEADLSTGAVFASFSDKADLFSQVIVADGEALYERMSHVSETGPVAETLFDMLSLGYAKLSDELALTQAAIGFSWVRDLEHEAGHRRVMRLLLDRLSEVLKRAVEQGELSPDLDATLTSEMLLESYLSNFRKAIFDGWDTETIRSRLASQINVLLAGYRSAA